MNFIKRLFRPNITKLNMAQIKETGQIVVEVGHPFTDEEIREEIQRRFPIKEENIEVFEK